MTHGSPQITRQSAIRPAVYALLTALGLTWGIWTLWRDPPAWPFPPRAESAEQEIRAVMATAGELQNSASNPTVRRRLFSELDKHDMRKMESTVASILDRAYMINMGGAALLLIAGAGLVTKRYRSLTVCAALVLVSALLIPVPYAKLLASIGESKAPERKPSAESVASFRVRDTEFGRRLIATEEAFRRGADAQGAAARLDSQLTLRRPAWRALAGGAAGAGGLLRIRAGAG